MKTDPVFAADELDHRGHKTRGRHLWRAQVVRPTGGRASHFDERIETPFGPAAGPNTQLAQNIVASYVAGSRFFELKTV